MEPLLKFTSQLSQGPNFEIKSFSWNSYGYKSNFTIFLLPGKTHMYVKYAVFVWHNISQNKSTLFKITSFLTLAKGNEDVKNGKQRMH